MKELADITLILDESCSMMSVREATIEGFNAFIQEQKKVDLPAVMTLLAFSAPQLRTSLDQPNALLGVYPYQWGDPCRVVFQSRPLKEVKKLTKDDYNPSGYSTALYDAMGHAIDSIGQRLALLPEAARPNKVLVVTMTDGEENSSKRFNCAQVKEMVSHQRTKYSWEFLYVGANQDAFKVGGGLSIPANQCVQYSHDKVGTTNAMLATAGASNDYRRGGSVSYSAHAAPGLTVKP